eukprot:6057547-Prymnesium_polylepis.1
MCAEHASDECSIGLLTAAARDGHWVGEQREGRAKRERGEKLLHGAWVGRVVAPRVLYNPCHALKSLQSDRMPKITSHGRREVFARFLTGHTQAR